MKINYAFVVFGKTPDENNDLPLYHMCLYEVQPSQDDYESFVSELETKEEFGLMDKKLDVDYEVIFLDSEGLNQLRQYIDLPEEINDQE